MACTENSTQQTTSNPIFSTQFVRHDKDEALFFSYSFVVLVMPLWFEFFCFQYQQWLSEKHSQSIRLTYAMVNTITTRRKKHLKPLFSSRQQCSDL